MSKARYGAPKRAYLATLRRPNEEDFAGLTNAVVEAIVRGEEDVVMSFSYLLKFPKTFPTGRAVSSGDYTNVRRIKAKKLLVWLFDNGRTDVTMELLVGGLVSSGMAAGKLERLLTLENLIVDDEMKDTGEL